jgi:flagellar biosynthesis chaperone FliJ
MKHTLSIARVARDEVRVAYAQSTQRLDAARTELATIQRRGELAQQINDQETVAVAARFTESQRSTIALLERKVAVQHDELALVERTVNEMEEELRSVTGIGPRSESAADRASDDEEPRAEPAEYRNLDTAARAQIADERLAELKRKMGKS